MYIIPSKDKGYRRWAMYGTETTVLRDAAKSALEEELEESSVTDLRHGLLPTIDRIQKNPATRVLIRKHGTLRAVLMSAQTYDAFKKLVNLVVQKTDFMRREEKIDAAFQRLQDERPSANEQTMAAGATSSEQTASPSPQRKGEAKVILGEIEEKLRELDTALGA
jgi:PHD/YefM family antitoxin component YafN of YafNO toxin-antitoxin module